MRKELQDAAHGDGGLRKPSVSSDALTQDVGNDAWMVPIPATFVVGRDGKVVARFIDPDFRKRMELDDLLKALKDAG